MNSDELNTIAWNKEVKRNNYWTRPVTKEAIEEARKGNLTLPFLVDKPMRKDWIDQLGNEVLLVGAGGGQQAPLLSAYGKKVTLVDISEMQLKQDEFVKKRDNLTFDIIQGSMSERLNFNANSFDSVVNPVSINFIKNPKYFYEEVKRVLKPNGIFITAFANPALYMFSPKALEKGKQIGGKTLGGQGTLAYDSLVANAGHFSVGKYITTVYTPFAQILDANGVSHEGVGCIPDIPVEFDKAQFDLGHDLRLAAAFDYINQ